MVHMSRLTHWCEKGGEVKLGPKHFVRVRAHEAGGERVKISIWPQPEQGSPEGDWPVYCLGMACQVWESRGAWGLASWSKAWGAVIIHGLALTASPDQRPRPSLSTAQEAQVISRSAHLVSQEGERHRQLGCLNRTSTSRS
jgi:hypothetical protein